MKLISHRGNLTGPNPERENSLQYIEEAIDAGFDCEVDLWEINGELFLGHDSPKELISMDILYFFRFNLWIHCKNAKALQMLSERKYSRFNYFFHDKDQFTITSLGYIWANYDVPFLEGSIRMLKKYEPIQKGFLGVCSDYIKMYVE